MYIAFNASKCINNNDQWIKHKPLNKQQQKQIKNKENSREFLFSIITNQISHPDEIKFVTM